MPKIFYFLKLVRAGFHAILTCGPVKTSFQVALEIYDDKVGQSGERILSSHITKRVIVHTVCPQGGERTLIFSFVI